MAHRDEVEFRFTYLSARDVDEIFALYLVCQSSAPHGFLARRTNGDYRKFYQSPENVIGAGARADGRLVAYCGIHRVFEHPYGAEGLLKDIRPADETVYTWHGRFVHPEHRNRQLSHRVLGLLQDEFVRRNVTHRLGLISVENDSAIKVSLRDGGLLIGLTRDETSLNYIVYSGQLRDRLDMNAAPIAIARSDHEHQKKLFAERRVIFGLSSDSRTASSSLRADPKQGFLFLPAG